MYPMDVSGNFCKLSRLFLTGMNVKTDEALQKMLKERDIAEIEYDLNTFRINPFLAHLQMKRSLGYEINTEDCVKIDDSIALIQSAFTDYKCPFTDTEKDYILENNTKATEFKQQVCPTGIKPSKLKSKSKK